MIVYSPNAEALYEIVEGTGDNLLQEDIDEGYVDYIYWNEYDRFGNEVDGGMALLTEYAQEMFSDSLEMMRYLGEVADVYIDDECVVIS